MGNFEDRSWISGDGLRLHFRDYPCVDPADTARAPVICVPGLTRNARDFEDLAPRIAQHRRVLCVDLRGRGDSDYARDPMTYVPPQYVTDLEALLAHEQIARFVAIGTSLGGLVMMLLAWGNPARIAGAVMNDIGPEIEAAGLARIRDYVGQGRAFETWMHGAWALQESQGETYPDFDLGDWLRLAKRTMALGSGGRIAFDYDMNIADPIEAAPADAPAPDLWPAWRALGQSATGGGPLLLLRGEHSDILAPHNAARMVDAVPGATLVTVPRVGHAPTLDEPVSVAAIEALLARVD
jgi:pimeloyl-ACP methyl ester carboxylesterase